MTFGKLAALACAGGLVTAPVSAETLIVAHGFQPAHVNFTDGIVPWMTCVTEATKGELEFEHFPSGQISGHRDSISSLQSGVAQVSGVVPGYETSKMPLNNMAALPGMGVTAVELNANYRAMLANGSALQKEWEELGVRPFLVISTPAYQLMTTGAPLDTIEKMSGVKIRVSAGPQSLAMQQLGGIPVEIGTPDMYVAMQRGTVEGTVLSLTSSVAYNLDELIKSSSTNGALASGQTVYSIAEKTFQGLTETQQTAVVDCGLKTSEAIAERLDTLQQEVIADYAAQGIVMYDFPPEVLAQIDSRLAAVAEAFIVDLEGRGLPAREAYTQYRAMIDN